MKLRNALYLSAAICGLSLTVPALAQESAPAMQFEKVMSIGSEGDGEGQFKYVEDMAVTDEGYLYATDAAHAYVQLFNKTTGEFLQRFGGKGDEDENLEKPEGIAVDDNDHVYIADYDSGYVKKYDSEENGNKWIKTFAGYGSEPGQNFKSEFISIHDGRLYLPEVGNNEVDVFDLDGNFLFSFGGPGTAPGKLTNPEAAKANSQGNIYVADLKNDRIQVFDKDGKFLFLFGTAGSMPGQLKAPAGIGIDKNDNIYVAEIGNDRVSVFDKNGNFITSFGSSAEFENLHGVFVDKETGWVYIANSGNNRIDVYKPVGNSAS